MAARDPDLLGERTERILTDLYYEAGWLGWATARHSIRQARELRKADDPRLTGTVDWDSWVPGDADAAKKLLGTVDAPLVNLLISNAGAVVAGVEQSRFDDLARILSEGAGEGLSMDDIASNLVDYLKADAAWAEVVARTEIRNAVTQASLDSYRDANVEQKEWLTAWDQACEICQAAEDMGPIPIDGTFDEAGDGPPGHPNCLCVILPVIPEPSAEPESGEQLPTDAEPAVTAPEPPTPTVDRFDVFLPSDVVLGERTAGPAGSNTGGVSGFWTGTDGIQRYVKEYKNPEQAWTELLTNTLYSRLDANAPITALSTHTVAGGDIRTLLVTEIVENKGTVGQLGLTSDIADQITRHFAADLWTANFDAVGTGLDNVVVSTTGDVYRIDSGGSLFFRAQGALKTDEMLNSVNAEAFFGKNPYYSQVLHEAGYYNVKDIADPLRTQIEEIRALVDASGGSRALIDDLLKQVEDASGRPLPFQVDTQRYADLLDKRLAVLEQKYGGQLAVPDPAATPGALAIDVGQKAGYGSQPPDMVHGDGAKSWARSGTQYGNKTWGAWQREVKANPEEARAVRNYSGTMYGAINNNMRDEMRAGNATVSNPIVRDTVQNIMNALARPEAAAPEDMVVNRGIGYMTQSRIQDMLGLRVGDILHDYGFMSTALGNVPGSFAGPVWMRIRVPAGSQGGYLGQLSGLQDGEREYLLQAGSSLRVEAIHEWQGKYIMDATLVDQRPGEIVNAEYFAGKMVVVL